MYGYGGREGGHLPEAAAADAAVCSARNKPLLELLAAVLDWFGDDTIALLLLLLLLLSDRSPAVVLLVLLVAAAVAAGLTTEGERMEMKSVRPVKAFCFSPLFQ